MMVGVEALAERHCTVPDELPQHVQDQVDAAAQENLALIQHVAEATGYDTGVVKSGEDPGFDALVRRVMDAIAKHRHRSCTHLKSPQPTVVRAWDTPFRLRCLRCEVATPAPEGDESFRCDICGVIAPDGFQTQHAEAGVFQLAFGRCKECFETKRASA